ncbi:MAG: transglycosylase domain-containing protein [Fibrobacteres bacterium]|nr:transglycosylase domain-containing protein [Fibrobacterota bacterium]
MKISPRLKWTILGTVLAALLLSLGAVGAFALSVRRDPDHQFTREAIMQILSKESTVYYSDGKTKVGTFFEGQHRDYVPFDSIPKAIINALVAAEDHNYWNHGGVDPKGLAYAMLDNLKSFSLKRGGSTLTQQTAKNLFKRPRTILGKVKELVNAFRLERHFTKQEILEFYLNQFYVSGNGHGVRIAARYFFNKDLADLNLLECAFIAGSVKGPNQYNPFMQDTPERKELALRRGQYRVAYVLKQMYRDGKITKDQYAAASHQKLEFRRGAFRFTLSTNMVKVKRLLETAPMQALLDKNDVTDFMTDGLQIYTTLDADLQRAAEYSTYANLSRLDLLLRGYHAPKDSGISLVSAFQPGGFYQGRIVTSPPPAKGGVLQPIEVAFGTARATIHPEAIERWLRTWNLHETGIADLPGAAARVEILRKHLAAGMQIYCGVPWKYQRPSPDGKPVAELEPDLEIMQRPEIQGGAQILREGRVLANVGGFGNTGYDRVNQARRQFGSGFKPIVYAAALELGWKPLDPLLNFRQMFRLGNVFYFPKPDHPPEDTVSMVWAGRRSENIASIYLLYHLFDKTPFARFWEIAKDIGMAPENFNMQGEFEIFVRDSLGLVLNVDRARELLYQKEAGDLAIDLTFEGKVGEAEALKSLPFGLGFTKEQQKYAGSGDKEDVLRYRILGRDFLAYLQEARAWEARATGGQRFTLARHNTGGQVGIFAGRPDSAWTPIGDPDSWLSDDSVLVEGEIGVGSLKRLSAKLDARGGDQPLGYSKENLYASQDFRALAGLRYIVAFSRKLGLTSPLDPVISYPLGVNVITLGEAVNAYQALKDGYTYKTKFGEPQLYIEKICLHDGTVIFEDYLDRERVITEKTRAGIEGILSAVVKGGTGQQIGRELKIPMAPSPATADKPTPELPLPAFGKTGTTNDYRNGAFLGFIAAPNGQNKGFDAASGYAIGVYTGFDDNVSMLRKGFKGTGSAVAIPAWIPIARAVAEVDAFSDRIDLLDLDIQATGQAPLFNQDKYQKYVVSKRTGLPLPATDERVLQNQGTYTEDLSDELSGGEGSADAAAYTTILIREE